MLPCAQRAKIRDWWQKNGSKLNLMGWLILLSFSSGYLMLYLTSFSFVVYLFLKCFETKTLDAIIYIKRYFWILCVVQGYMGYMVKWVHSVVHLGLKSFVKHSKVLDWIFVSKQGIYQNKRKFSFALKVHKRFHFWLDSLAIDDPISFSAQKYNDSNRKTPNVCNIKTHNNLSRRRFLSFINYFLSFNYTPSL